MLTWLHNRCSGCSNYRLNHRRLVARKQGSEMYIFSFVCTVIHITSILFVGFLIRLTDLTCVKRMLPVSSPAPCRGCACVPEYILGFGNTVSLFLSRQTGTWPESHPGFASWENIVKMEYPPHLIVNSVAAIITKHPSAFHLCLAE